MNKKIIKNILLIVFLIFLVVLKTPDKTYSIYKEELSTTINLSITSADQYTITYDSRGGEFSAIGTPSIIYDYKHINDTLGTLLIPTKSGYIFNGWYTDPDNGTRINSETLVTGTTTYYAHWIKMVCKKAETGTLHTETCESTGGCHTTNGGIAANTLIEYGIIPETDTPQVAYAYDCDVNDDGTYDAQTERFYYIRSYSDSNDQQVAVLVHYTSFDENGQMDSSKERKIYYYAEALTHLPTSDTWDNSELIEISGNITRFPSREDVTAACGSTNLTGSVNCRILFENTRFRSKSYGRSGIWLLEESGNHYRIHTEQVNVASVDVSGSNPSQNAARPVIEIPLNTIDGYAPKELYTVRYNANQGTFTNNEQEIRFNLLEDSPYGTVETPTRSGYVFAGWYTDPTNGTHITSSDTITGNITLYAHWSEVGYAITFDTQGGDPEDGYTVAIGQSLGSQLPIPTYTGRYFAGWYTAANGGGTKVDSSTVPTEDTIYYAYWLQNPAARIDNIYYSTVQKAVNDVANDDIEVTVHLVKNVDESVTVSSGQKVKFDVGSYIFSCTSDSCIFNNGTVTIYNGTISGSTTQPTLKNLLNATMYINGGTIIATNTVKGQAVYNDGGDVYISGGDISNVSNNNSDGRPAVHNTNKINTTAAGTLVITGGTITSSGYLGVRNDIKTDYSLIIGTEDNIHDTVNLVIQGGYKGVFTESNIKFYDGIIKGKEGTINAYSKITETEDGFTRATGTETIGEDTYQILYYYSQTPKWTLRFFYNDGTQDYTTQEIDQGDPIETFPTVTRTNYMLDGWYTNPIPSAGTQVTTSTVPDGNKNYYAVWTANINEATITPASPVNLYTGQTSQISLSGPDRMESVTYSSSNDNVATVSNSGLITAVAKGTATITITGSRSSETQTITVNVSNYTITYHYNDGSQNTIESEVVPGDDLGIFPVITRTNYLLDGWYTDTNYTTQVTTSTVPDGDKDYYAKWTGNINLATISPDTITIIPGQLGNISVSPTNPSESIESYTFTSNNTGVATVSNLGIVTGFSTGTTTITITGSRSTLTRTVTVNVINGYMVTFDTDGGNSIDPIGVMPGTSLGENMPSDPTKTDYYFAGWYNQSFTETYDENTVINSDMTFYAKMIPNDAVCEMNGTYYTSIQNAVDAINTTDLTTIYLIDDVTDGRTKTQSMVVDLYSDAHLTKRVVLDLQGHTLNYNGGAKVYAVRSRAAFLEIKNGTITSNANGSAAIEINAGNFTMNSGTIIVNQTNNRHALYNDGGTVLIGGDLTLTSKASGDFNGVIRGTITNVSGTMTITGGTIINTVGCGVVQNAGSLTIGIDDGVIDTTGLVIQGKTNGLDIKSGKTVTVYDGMFKGKNLAINTNDRTIIPDDTDYDTDETETIGTDTYKLTYLYSTLTPPATYTVNLNVGEGTVNPTSYTVNVGESIDETDLPTPTNGNYTFDGWVTEENGNTPVTFPITPAEGGETTIYAKWVNNATYTVNLNVGEGTVSPTSVTVNVGDSLYANQLPTPTNGVYTFDGWVTTDGGSTPVTFPITPSASGSTTIYAKWVYNASSTPVSFNTVNEPMTVYFNNIELWKTNQTLNSHTTFDNNMSSNFSNYSCSACNGPNTCSSPQQGEHCDLPAGYDTGITDDVVVYTYDTTNQERSENPITYTTSTGGIIYNMIPGETYYWESSQDSNVHGLVTATGQRRTIYTSVRNVRDLGGLEVDSDNDGTPDGTLKYGRLYRGAQLSTGVQGAIDVASLTKLGITREFDLRAQSEGYTNSVQQSRLPVYDIGDYTDPNNVVGFEDVIIKNYLINPEANSYYNVEHYTNYVQFKKYLQAIMRYIAYDDESIFFHCTIGTDRTGTMAYFLEGLLGVSLEDRVEDYELTYFFGLSNRTRFHDYLSGSDYNPRFYSMYMSYPDYDTIYNFYVYDNLPEEGDSAEVLAAKAAAKAQDDQLLADFKQAMINSY